MSPAEPLCPKCSKSNFGLKQIKSSWTNKNKEITYYAIIIFCTNCGHIIGCSPITKEGTGIRDFETMFEPQATSVFEKYANVDIGSLLSRNPKISISFSSIYNDFKNNKQSFKDNFLNKYIKLTDCKLVNINESKSPEYFEADLHHKGNFKIILPISFSKMLSDLGVNALLEVKGYINVINDSVEIYPCLIERVVAIDQLWS
jgi:hypothetical protein